MIVTGFTQEEQAKIKDDIQNEIQIYSQQIAQKNETLRRCLVSKFNGFKFNEG